MNDNEYDEHLMSLAESEGMVNPLTDLTAVIRRADEQLVTDWFRGQGGVL